MATAVVTVGERSKIALTSEASKASPKDEKLCIFVAEDMLPIWRVPACRQTCWWVILNKKADEKRLDHAEKNPLKRAENDPHRWLE